MIFIWGENGDSMTNKVIDWLYFHGASYLRLNETNSIRFENLVINSGSSFEGEITCNILGMRITLKNNDISGFWYRRASVLFDNQPILKRDNIDDTILLNLNRYLVDDELRVVIEYYKKQFKLHNYINVPSDANTNKLLNLRIAAEEGLRIPSTLVTSKKESLLKFANQYESVITKGIYDSGVILSKTISAGSYTHLLSVEDLTRLPDNFGLSLFQMNVRKEFELRVFYLNEKCYTMAIFSQEDVDTKIDFRKGYNLNRTSPFTLPNVIEQKIISFMKRIELNCGSIDLILDTNGDYFFLEVNPVGQFEFLSRPCNYYIEKKIAECLISSINEKRST